MSALRAVLATPSPASLFGRITDAVTGLPLADARARLTKYPSAFAVALGLDATLGTVCADANGVVRFYRLPDGAYTLVIDAPGTGTRYGSVTSSLTVAAASGATLANTALPPTALAGKLQTGTGAKAAPVVMALVKVRGSNDQTYTDLNGNYQLPAVEAGARTVEFSAIGLKTQTAAANLKQGQTSTVNATLSP